MIDSDRIEFAKTLSAAQVLYAEKLSTERAEQYFQALRGYPVLEIAWAMHEHIRDTRPDFGNGPPRGRIFPKPAHLLEHLEQAHNTVPYHQSIALPAYEEVLERPEAGKAMAICEWAIEQCKAIRKAKGPKACAAWTRKQLTKVRNGELLDCE